MTKPLSPAAQAVLDAAANVYWDWCDMSPASSSTIAAAALEAVADQVVPLAPKPNDTFCCPPVYTMLWECATNIRNQLLSIAAELKKTDG
jgi:hypothetical protein